MSSYSNAWARYTHDDCRLSLRQTPIIAQQKCNMEIIDFATGIIDDIPSWILLLSNMIFAGVVYILKKRHEANLQSKQERLIANLKRNHDIELQNLRRDHEVEIARQISYNAGKRERYEAYWQMMDSFGSMRRDPSKAHKMISLLNEYASDFVRNVDNPDIAVTAFSNMMSAIQEGLKEGTHEFMQIRNETQSLRLYAGERLFSLLTELESKLETLFIDSSSFVSGLANFNPGSDIEKQLADSNLDKLHVETQNEEISRLYNEIRNEMRRELAH